MVTSVLVTVIVLVMIFQAIGDTADEVKAAAQNASTGNMSGSGSEDISPANVYPLTAFLEPDGIVLLAFIAGVILAILAAVFAFRK
jgi:hypothetical protein